IERSNDGSSWLLLTTAGINTTHYSNLGLSEATTYHYRVRAENIFGSSDYSNTDSATTHFVEPSSNLALNKAVTFSSQQMEVGNENPAMNAVDGNLATRWSSARDSLWPQWLEVDLESIVTINKTEVVCFSDRAYQFAVDAKTDENGPATRVVDRTANTTPGSISSPITDLFDSVSARFVRITVTGAYGYAGPWTSIMEFRIFNSSGPVSADSKTPIPTDFIVSQNYPNPFNPFNPSTRIAYQIPRSSLVSLIIFNVIGQEVTKLVDEYQQAGRYVIGWNGGDSRGRKVNSGAYFAVLRAGDFVRTIKLLLIQ
ncbi:MAG TPA: discoidin domain-containing protein, partial [Bacteroidota bacterium]